MRKIHWGSLHRLRPRHTQEAGAALFQGLRIRLTLWYCGVLGAALVLFGVALYLGTQYSLLHPIESTAQEHAQEHQRQWLGFAPARACPFFDPRGQGGPPIGGGQRFTQSELVICFDQNGSLLPGENTMGQPVAFLTNTVVMTALQSANGQASDTVDAGGTTGQIYRYAQVVSSPLDGSKQGVILIGEFVQTEKSALSSLLVLLLSIGGIALFGAGLGGLFLSNRALVPARLAWANQQRFIADASHELRTPLTLMRADAEVLLRGRERLEAEDAGLLEDIVIETNHMSIIATNLLTLARLDSGTTHREHDIVNLAELALEGARRVNALAEQRGIAVQVENASPAYVIGDPMLLEQAMLVLLDNAIKYNRRAGRVIMRTAAQNGQALLEVSDTGIGISAEHLAHLGERFYRVDKARSREAGGTGLGLSIARSIAVAHGGQLSLFSAPEQGTMASLALPLAHEI